MNQVFSLTKANLVVKKVHKITHKYSTEVEALINTLDSMSGDSPKSEALEKQVNLLIEKWQKEVQNLGVLPKGLWICDFDNGSGYYCWKYPETSLNFKHSYTDGYSKRVLINETTMFRQIKCG